jgi:D-glycero-beta-D-manno-heptose-7-phosphate kinase
MSFMSLESIFESFNHLRVLIVGDVMIDDYVWGKVERISPEAPVPVVLVERQEKRLGGAANVALNVQALGAEPVLCSVVGDDLSGEDFMQLLQKHHLTNEGILKSSERITTVKQRILSGHQHILRLDTETDKLLTLKDSTLLYERIENQLNHCDAIIFEDYDKGVIDDSLIGKVVAEAKKRNIPTIVDPKKRNFLNYQGVSLFKPNLKELKEGLKIDFNLSEMGSLKEASTLLKERLKVQNILITLSERGVFMDSVDGQYHIAAHLRSIADVSGAGDTVVSVAALALALQLPFKTLAGLANLAGGLVCEQLGVVSIDKALLLREAVEHRIM